MPKVNPETGEMMTDEPDQEDDELAGGHGSVQDPHHETGGESFDQQVTGH